MGATLRPGLGTIGTAWAGLRAAGGLLVACAFFGLFYLHVRHIIDPRLIYHGSRVTLPSGQELKTPVFSYGPEFFHRLADRPGGLAEYAAAYFSQYHYYERLGPLVLTGLAGLVFVLGALLMRIAGIRAPAAAFLAPILLVVIYNQYVFCLGSLVGLAAVLAAADVYGLVAGRLDRAGARLVLCVALMAGLYYVAGSPAVVLGILAALIELTGRRCYPLAAVLLLISSLAPLAGALAFDLYLSEAYTRLSGIDPRDSRLTAVAMIILYALFPLVLAAPAMWRATPPPPAGRRGWIPITPTARSRRTSHR